MTYEISDAAYEDYLALYAEGIAKFGARQAILYSDSLERAFELIGANPKMARLRTELSPPVRVHPHGAHLIVYLERDGHVMILRIRHGRENWTDDPL